MLIIKRTSAFKSDYKKALNQNKDIQKLKDDLILLCQRNQLDLK